MSTSTGPCASGSVPSTHIDPPATNTVCDHWPEARNPPDRRMTLDLDLCEFEGARSVDEHQDVHRIAVQPDVVTEGLVPRKLDLVGDLVRRHIDTRDERMAAGLAAANLPDDPDTPVGDGDPGAAELPTRLPL